MAEWLSNQVSGEEKVRLAAGVGPSQRNGRSSMSKIVLSLFTAAAMLTAVPVFAADTEDRSYMPDNCADRDRNCVKDDGPPPRTPWVHRRPPNNGNSGNSSGNNSSSNKNSGTAWASGTAAPRTK